MSLEPVLPRFAPRHLVRIRRSRSFGAALVGRTERLEVSARLIERDLVRTTAIVRILELKAIVFPPADRADVVRPRRLFVERQMPTTRTGPAPRSHPINVVVDAARWWTLGPIALEQGHSEELSQ